jgi:hypothetical protein
VTVSQRIELCGADGSRLVLQVQPRSDVGPGVTELRIEIQPAPGAEVSKGVRLDQAYTVDDPMWLLLHRFADQATAVHQDYRRLRAGREPELPTRT